MNRTHERTVKPTLQQSHKSKPFFILFSARFLYHRILSSFLPTHTLFALPPILHTCWGMVKLYFASMSVGRAHCFTLASTWPFLFSFVSVSCPLTLNILFVLDRRVFERHGSLVFVLVRVFVWYGGGFQSFLFLFLSFSFSFHVLFPCFLGSDTDFGVR